jgi:hypothetical protein
MERGIDRSTLRLMLEPSNEATTRRAEHASRLDREMERTAPLREGEALDVQGIVRCRSRMLPRVAYLRVSPNRICVAQHFALRPDQLTEIPRAAVTQTRVEGSWVRLSFTHETGPMTLFLKPWERRLRRIVVEPVLRVSLQELSRVLSS